MSMQYMGVWGFVSLYFLILWVMLSILVGILLIIILICGLFSFVFYNYLQGLFQPIPIPLQI